jgi:hypothetical protein
MEKGPKIRFVGNASNSEVAEKVKKNILDALFNHFNSLNPSDLEELKKHERKKSPTEIAIIEIANRETSQLMERFGLEPYDIPQQNLHIVSPDLFGKIVQNKDDAIGTAVTFRSKQGIIFNAEYARASSIAFLAQVIHELIHLKSHLSIEIEEEIEEDGRKSFNPSFYREGLKVFSSQKSIRKGMRHQHFLGLD